MSHATPCRRFLGPILLMVTVATLPSPAAALSNLPFPPAFAEEVEEAFFEGGHVSIPKLERLRANLSERRREAVAVFAADLRAEGRKKKAARKRAERKKLVRIYDLLLGDDDAPGWINLLAAESDPVQARVLAGRIIELDRAVLLEGSRPKSVSIVENLASISVLEWEVPGETLARHADREATNLVDPASGEFLEAEDLAQRLEAGVDASRLGPPDRTSFWKNPGAIARVDPRAAYYGGGAPVHHDLDLVFPTQALLAKIKKSQTKPKFEIEVELDGEEHEYKLKVGGEIHSEPTVGAILATLGFNADVVKHVEDFRVDLGETKIEDLRNDWRSYFEFKRVHLSYRFDDYFDVVEDAEGTAIIARQATLTAKPADVTRAGPWPWGANGNGGIREARALGIISIWLGNTDMKEAENNKILLRDMDGGVEMYHLLHDAGHAFGRVISEQVDAFPWDIGHRTLMGNIEFNYHSTWNPSLRHRITYADGRWATRLIAQLTREQIEAVVGFGHWPEPVGALLVEKLINRRNQLVELFEVENEETPSGPITLLPVDRDISTPDEAVVDGDLLESVFEGATQEYDNYWEEFIGPVWESAKLLGVGVFQQTIGLVPALIFDSDSVGLPKFVVLDLLINISREVEENPRPTGAGDYFLVRDRLLLGLRVGGGLIATGTTSIYRSYTLVQPAGTRRDAHYADDTILNVRLPYHVWKENLPDDFVLVRESFVDLRGNLTTESLAGSVPPVGATAGIGAVRLSRDVLSRKDGRLLAYEDKSTYVDQDFEAFVNAIFVRIPFLREGLESGTIEGRFFDLSEPDSLDQGQWSDAVSRLVRDGDFSGVEEAVPPVSVDASFVDRFGWVRLPFVVQRSRRDRTDRIVLGGDGRGRAPEAFVQSRLSTGGFWTFLDWGEDHLHTVTALARADRGTGETSLDDLGDLETPRVVSTYFVRDRDTHNDELAEGYIGFINGLDPAPDGEPLIDFTPELHSENGIWGDLEVAVRVGYSKSAVKRLRKITGDEIFAELEKELDIEPRTLQKYRRYMGAIGKKRRVQQTWVPRRLRRPITAARHTARGLERARAEANTAEWMADVMRALSSASIRRAGAYDASVLGAIHRLLDEDTVSIDGIVRPPPWVENRMLGSVPLAAESRKKRHRLHRQFIDFDPKCTSGLYRMLESFEADHTPDRYYGAICDGARGALAD